VVGYVCARKKVEREHKSRVVANAVAVGQRKSGVIQSIGLKLWSKETCRKW
jgi:hypothetical protein